MSLGILYIAQDFKSVDLKNINTLKYHNHYFYWVIRCYDSIKINYDGN